MSTKNRNASDASSSASVSASESSASKHSSKKSHSSKSHRSAKKASKKVVSRGAQWKEWPRPFRPDSTTDKAFVLCLKKGGIRQSEFHKKVKGYGGDSQWCAKRFARGTRASWTWGFSKDNERYFIQHVRLNGKKPATKAA